MKLFHLNINNCLNVSIMFSMDKRDLLQASMQYGANFDVYPQYSLIEDCVASLRSLCTAATTKL